MKFTIPALIAAVCLLGASAAQAAPPQVLADIYRDFSSSQGDNNFYYGVEQGSILYSGYRWVYSVTAMQRDTPNSAIDMDAQPGNGTVMSWHSPYAGWANVTATITPTTPYDGDQGARVRVAQYRYNGMTFKMIDERVMEGNWTDPFNVNFNVLLQENDYVDFKFSNLSTDKGYSSQWTGQIVAAPVPEPASIVMLTMGLSGLGGLALRRKRK